MSSYDVIIVGAGPAGIFAALELLKKQNLKVLLLDKGKDIRDRLKLAESLRAEKFSVLCGFGGAGAFSDGKLNLSTEIGGWLADYISEEELEKLIDYVDGVYQSFSAPQEEYGKDKEKVEELKRKAAEAGLTLVAGRIKHLGTEVCRSVLLAMREHLDNKVEVRTDTLVSKVLVNKGKIEGVLTSTGEKFLSKTVIVAPGREGADWLTSEAKRLELGITNNDVDIGIRVEVPAVVLELLTSVLYESKLIYTSKSFQDKVRTFCMNPYGEVTKEIYSDVVTVNGHSYANRKTANTNFALLASTNFTEPFKEPTAYGKYIARLANLLGDGIIVQRLGDLKKGQRSTDERISESKIEPTLKEVTAGDLSFVLPFRYISDILEMLEALDKLVPGVNSFDTLLYGVEVKFYSSRLKLNSALQTEIDGLYAIGDGAGITRGLVQSSVAGVIAARDTIKQSKV